MASLEDLSVETRDNLARLMRDLADNPKTRKEALRLTKQLRPDEAIPELELDDAIERATKASEERIRTLEARLQERDAEADLARRREALIKSGKVADETEIAAVEKIMVDKKIHDHETAADYHRWMQQAAAPTPATYDPRVLNDAAKSSLAQFFKDPVGAARGEAAKAFQELRTPRRPIGL